MVLVFQTSEAGSIPAARSNLITEDTCMPDQKTDDDQGRSPNATFKTTAVSPSHGQAARFRGDGLDPSADNEMYKAVPGREIPGHSAGELAAAATKTSTDRNC